jgi:hypothetical protein
LHQGVCAFHHSSSRAEALRVDEAMALLAAAAAPTPRARPATTAAVARGCNTARVYRLLSRV